MYLVLNQLYFFYPNSVHRLGFILCILLYCIHLINYLIYPYYPLQNTNDAMLQNINYAC